MNKIIATVSQPDNRFRHYAIDAILVTEKDTQKLKVRDPFREPILWSDISEIIGKLVSENNMPELHIVNLVI